MSMFDTFRSLELVHYKSKTFYFSQDPVVLFTLKQIRIAGDLLL